jgi:hypothetical protein
MGNFDLPVLTWNDTDVLQGEEDYELVIAASTVNYSDAGYANGTVMFWEAGAKLNTSDIVTDGLALIEDNRFIVTSMDEDLADIETLYYEVSDITVDNDGTFTVVLEDLIGDDDLEFDQDDMEDEAYETTVELVGFNSANTTIYLEFTAPGTETYNVAVSETGLVVTLPVLNTTDFMFREADDDDNINTGATFNASVEISSNDKAYVSYEASDNEQEESDDNFVDVIASALASVITTDESGDEYDFAIEYFGTEVIAEVSVIAGGESTAVSEAGVMTVRDNEVSSVSGKNLIVVGGSAINSVAAELLGGAYSEAAFTDATGVAAGQFMIKSFDRAGGKTALLVAGYNAADTEKAVTYLLNNDVDTSSADMVKTSTTYADVA